MASVDRLEVRLTASRESAGKLLEAVASGLATAAAEAGSEKASPRRATVK